MDNTLLSWQDAQKAVMSFADKLGRGLDPGICDTVTALNALGIVTKQSCEGHLDHGRPFPWISLECKEAITLFDQSSEAFARKSYEEAHDFMRKAEALQGRKQVKLLDLLTKFYSRRQVEHRRILIVYSPGPGIIILESQGAMLLIGESANVQAQRLRIYQEEMQAFTSFLKNEFFRDDI